jgi:pimeloyl-ACP methyl ester carboxylesterase
MSTWILLRGLTRESGHWGAFADLLQRRTPHSRILALDLPGNGTRNGSTSPARIEAMTQWCRDHMRSQGIAPPYHLLGMSMGGMVAVDWAARAPAEIAGCVLVNTSLRPFSPWHRRLRPGHYGALIALALTPGFDAWHERVILRLTSRDPAGSSAALNEWIHLRRTRPVSAANALRQLLAAARFRATAPAPAVPLLVLASRHDRLVDWRCSLELARRWRTDFGVHPSAGHDLTLDAAAWVADQVVQWSAARSSGTGRTTASALVPTL